MSNLKLELSTLGAVKTVHCVTVNRVLSTLGAVKTVHCVTVNRVLSTLGAVKTVYCVTVNIVRKVMYYLVKATSCHPINVVI